MEQIQTTSKKYKLAFAGEGAEYFKVVIVNSLLILVTLGLYYPWAKAKQLKFLYKSTEFENNHFMFHGTGGEMFKGFIKAVILFLLILVISGAIGYFGFPTLGALFFYLTIFLITPFIIHGSYRYKTSRTSWSGIRMGYRGEAKEFALNFYKWTFFTSISFGIYGSWMAMHIRRYLLSNIRIGDVKMKYTGTGTDFFVLNLMGGLLIPLTLGIYMFWHQKNLFEFLINNLKLEKEDQKIELKSTLTGGDVFGLVLINMLILMVTFGLGYAWVVTRTLKIMLSKIELEGNIDLDSISQTEEDYKDATADDMGDMLDLNI